MFNTLTWVGTGLLLAAIILLFLPLLLLGRLRSPTARRVWTGGILLSLLFLGSFLVALVLAAPSGDPGPDSPIHHRYSEDGHFHRFSLTNLIPEGEQVNLGFRLMPFLDPILTRAQARRALGPTLDLYGDMEADANFRELGSAMGLAYAGLVGRSLDAGHYYLYVPQEAGRDPLPALIFLHGAAGNFKVYTWIWSRLAEEAGVVIIAPSYGFGTWDEAGAATVLRALADARQVANIDPNRVYLAGLSNGGVGVSLLATERPDLFAGLIFISPVLPGAILSSDAFRDEWTGRPVLVLTGADDRRIPLAYVKERVAQMGAANVDVTDVIYPDEDHFLIFSQSDQIVETVWDWLRSQSH